MHGLLKAARLHQVDALPGEDDPRQHVLGHRLEGQLGGLGVQGRGLHHALTLGQEVSQGADGAHGGLVLVTKVVATQGQHVPEHVLGLLQLPQARVGHPQAIHRQERLVMGLAQGLQLALEPQLHERNGPTKLSRIDIDSSEVQECVQGRLGLLAIEP